jgi:hypothetical protein
MMTLAASSLDYRLRFKATAIRSLKLRLVMNKALLTTKFKLLFRLGRYHSSRKETLTRLQRKEKFIEQMIF